MFSNAVKIMIFISDVQYYICMKLCKTAGSIHLFKLIGMLKPEDIKLNKYCIWNTLETDWKEVSVTFNDDKLIYQELLQLNSKTRLKSDA